MDRANSDIRQPTSLAHETQQWETIKETSGSSSPKPQPTTTTATTTAQFTDQNRKRSGDISTLDEPTQKRQRPIGAIGTADDKTDSSDPVDYWRKHHHWPPTYFEFEGTMSSLPKPSTSSIKPSGTTTSASGNKTILYRTPEYEVQLANSGSYLKEDSLGVGDEGEMLCQQLLETEQAVPQDSNFNADLFKATCDYLNNRSEAMVIREIGLLIVPSPVQLARWGAENLNILAETVDESWRRSVAVSGPRPQPDFSVGFDPTAFSSEERNRLKFFTGGPSDRSYFAATWKMYFPFLSCEVKSSDGNLKVADRQNAHSATVAVRAIVELFRLVEREQEVDHQILAFSISHNQESVRIYAHYPVVKGKATEYYRYPIRSFYFTEQRGREKWTTYKFTKNIYDNWAPKHLKRIRSAIKDVPENINFDVSQGSELQFPSQTGLSQGLEGHHLSESASVAGQDDGSSVANAGNPVTSETSISQEITKVSKRPSKKPRQ